MFRHASTRQVWKFHTVCLSSDVNFCLISRSAGQNKHLFLLSCLVLAKRAFFLLNLKWTETFYFSFLFKLHAFVYLTVALWPSSSQHQYAYSPYCSVSISWGADKKNLFNNQVLFKLVIISFILMTLMFESGVIL